MCIWVRDAIIYVRTCQFFSFPHISFCYCLMSQSKGMDVHVLSFSLSRPVCVSLILSSSVVMLDTFTRTLIKQRHRRSERERIDWSTHPSSIQRWAKPWLTDDLTCFWFRSRLLSNTWISSCFNFPIFIVLAVSRVLECENEFYIWRSQLSYLSVLIWIR